MTPQEKAIELVNKFPLNGLILEYGDAPKQYKEHAKRCAKIAVEVILESEPRCPSNVDWDDVGGTHQYYYEAQREDANKYWQEVKKEICDL